MDREAYHQPAHREPNHWAPVPDSSQDETLMPHPVPIAPLEDDLTRTPNGHGRPRRRLLGPVATTYVRSVSARIGPLLRVALATVFIWFGALKLTGHSPVAGQLRDTLLTAALREADAAVAG